MIPVLTLEDYQKLYPNDPAEAFDRLLPDAQLRMDVLTANRWRAVAEGDWREGRVDRCLAALLHLSIQGEQSPALAGITSVSNDGYSESYAKLTPQDMAERERGEAAKWLSCTGLVSAL